MSNEQYEQGLAKTFVVCGVVIERDGKYLLVQEKQPKAYKKWNLPAGKVDYGESLEEAAIREAKEECGVDVELVSHVFTLHEATNQPVFHAFKAKVTGGDLHFPADEILDARWFSRDEIAALDLRNERYILGSIDAVITDYSA